MHYVDSITGATYPLGEPRWRGDSGAHVNLGAAPGLGRGDIDGSVHSLWRYRQALLVDAADAVTMGEGWTPLVRGAWDGVAVDFKLDFMMPTGSFKDRGMTVMVSYLRSRGVTDVLEDSTGNVAISYSAYCARAGMRCRVLVPETASYPKIAQIAACGADVVTIRGSRQDVADAALAMSRDLFYASHNWQPFFAEGTKTLAYELWEQLDFRAPDSVVVPVGYGANVLGCDRGFSELLRRGEIARMPRLYGVQAANCAPYFAAFVASSWSVTLHYQTFSNLICALEAIEIQEESEFLEALKSDLQRIQEDFNRFLIYDEVVTGYAYFLDLPKKCARHVPETAVSGRPSNVPRW